MIADAPSLLMVAFRAAYRAYRTLTSDGNGHPIADDHHRQTLPIRHYPIPPFGAQILAPPTGLLGRGRERRLVDWKDLEFLRGDPGAARQGRDYHRQITRLQPPEIARLLDALPYLHAAELLTLIPDPIAADTLEVMTRDRQTQVVQVLDEDQAVRLFALMAPDAAADLLGYVKPERARHLLPQIPEVQRQLIVDLLRYPDDTAGRIMTNQLVCVPMSMRVGEARRS